MGGEGVTYDVLASHPGGRGSSSSFSDDSIMRPLEFVFVDRRLSANKRSYKCPCVIALSEYKYTKFIRSSFPFDDLFVTRVIFLNLLSVMST